MNRETAFLRFWRAENLAGIGVGQPELLLGEASRRWRDRAERRS